MYNFGRGISPYSPLEVEMIKEREL